jgi:hypothetical protein
LVVFVALVEFELFEGIGALIRLLPYLISYTLKP